jgi:polyphosphate kinase 2 (PPK2 family)
VRHTLAEMRHDPLAIRQRFETGAYPDKIPTRRLPDEAHVLALPQELLQCQRWVEETGQKIIILFDERDATRKGGTIKRFMQRMNPRTARAVALLKPSEPERSQWYFQRYTAHLPASGELGLFDRSWYNRVGVKRVMGLRTPSEYLAFMRQYPQFERMLTRSGIRLFKYWFSVSREEQRTLQGTPRRSAKAMETVTDRSGLARQVERLYRGERGHVLLHRYRRRALDRGEG